MPASCMCGCACVHACVRACVGPLLPPPLRPPAAAQASTALALLEEGLAPAELELYQLVMTLLQVRALVGAAEGVGWWVLQRVLVGGCCSPTPLAHRPPPRSTSPSQEALDPRFTSTSGLSARSLAAVLAEAFFPPVRRAAWGSPTRPPKRGSSRGSAPPPAAPPNDEAVVATSARRAALVEELLRLRVAAAEDAAAASGA